MAIELSHPTFTTACQVNERFSNMIGSAEELSSWASQYAALPAYLLAAMLVHDDRADFLRQYVVVEVAQIGVCTYAFRLLPSVPMYETCMCTHPSTIYPPAGSRS